MTETFQYLTQKYKKIGLSRQELATELTVSLSTIDRLLKQGLGLPSYKRIGMGERARIVFPVSAVATFLDEQLISCK